MRQRFADSLNRRFGTNYTADEFFVTGGAAPSLCGVFRGLSCPGDEYILFAPYFPEYRVFCEAAGGVLVGVPCTEPDFQIDLAALRAAITEKTVVISARGSAITRVTDKFKVGDTVTLTPNVIADMMTSTQKKEWAGVTEAMAGFFTLMQKGNATACAQLHPLL